MYKLLVLSIIVAIFADAQTPLLLSGKVVDPAGFPIPQVQVSAGAHSVVTGTDGVFTLAVGSGWNTVKFTKPGFTDTSRRFHAPVLSTAPVVIELQIRSLDQTLIVEERSDNYRVKVTSSATKTRAPLSDVPQSVVILAKEQVRDQMMMSLGDVVRYVPGVTAHQGENNRDQIVIRGNSSSADFFVNGVRDDAQYYRDLYNLEQVEVLKGPNAMIFGRGGGGGVINRVTKEPTFSPIREITIQGGSFGSKRLTADFDQPLGRKAGVRLNGMYENSDSFRRFVNLDRRGISSGLTLLPFKSTKVLLSYEHLNDSRVADRGMPSFQGRPVDSPVSTFFGNPKDSHVESVVDLGSILLEQQVGRFNIRNRTQFGGYDRFYQNYVPGAVNSAQTQVSLSAYKNASQRLNVFNQTDVTASFTTAGIKHTLLGGTEFGRQATDNLRNTGYFRNTDAAILIPLADPSITTPVTFRQSSTDANNHLKALVDASYIQDQIQISRRVQLVGGVRFDHFDLRYNNNRNGDYLRRIDNLISPRAGIVVKPVTGVSLYGSYSVSYLPSSGDQFSSLTAITQQVKPEKFINYEGGVKWDVSKSFAFTTAIYRLDRTNTRATDPNDPTRIIQTGSTETNGLEFGVQGAITRKWRVSGGYAFQDAFISNATTAARAGAQVAQVPHRSFSLWNNYQIHKRWGAGLGVVNRSDMFAAVDNTVRLPGYARVDCALFANLTERLGLQVNAENLFNSRYFLNADSNTNISPGQPIGVRAGLIFHF